MSIAALVLGICSLVIPTFGFLLAITGLVLGIIGKKKAQEVGAPTSMATAGIICAAIAVGWGIISTILCFTVCTSTGLFAQLFNALDYYW